MTTRADTITATLAEHGQVQFSLISAHGPWHLTCSCTGWTCECDDPMGMEDGECLNGDSHRAHVAAILAEQETQRLKAELVWWGRGA